MIRMNLYYYLNMYALVKLIRGKFSYWTKLTHSFEEFYRVCLKVGSSLFKQRICGNSPLKSLVSCESGSRGSNGTSDSQTVDCRQARRLLRVKVGKRQRRGLSMRLVNASGSTFVPHDGSPALRLTLGPAVYYTRVS